MSNEQPAELLPARTLPESSEDYPGIVVRSDRYRIITDRQNIQWIIQKRAGVRHGRARWDALSYCRGRAALTQLWRGLHPHSDPDDWPEFARLPAVYRSARHGKR